MGRNLGVAPPVSDRVRIRKLSTWTDRAASEKCVGRAKERNDHIRRAATVQEQGKLRTGPAVALIDVGLPHSPRVDGGCNRGDGSTVQCLPTHG